MIRHFTLWALVLMLAAVSAQAASPATTKEMISQAIAQSQASLAQLKSVPVEFAGALVVTVPGPAVTVANPTREQLLQILNERSAYWQEQKASFAKAGLQSLAAMADDIVADVRADVDFVTQGWGGGQDLIARKTTLLQQQMLPRLFAARAALTKTP
jgi:hypothetical protein